MAQLGRGFRLAQKAGLDVAPKGKLRREELDGDSTL